MKLICIVAHFLLVAAIAQTKTFSSDLVIPLSEEIQSLSIDASGKIVAGQFRSLIRFDEDGTVDTSLPVTDVTGLGIENDGKVVALELAALMRIYLDSPEPSRLVTPIDGFILQPDGKILSLLINPPPRNPRNTLLMLNPDGTADAEFTPVQLQGTPFTSLALQENGQILVAATQGGTIHRYNTNGTTDGTFNAATVTPGRVNAILVQADGKILIGGEFNTVGTTPRNGLARLHPNGSIDTTFNPDSAFTTNVHALSLQADGKIVVAGIFSSIGGRAATNLARLNADGTFDATFKSAPVAPPRLIVYKIPLVLQDDGSVVVGSGSNLVRMTNPDPAIQSFTREGSTLTWLRGGSTPEIYHARFHASLDGVSWTDLGPGERVPGGWRLIAADIPAGARLRARGYVVGSSYYVDHVPGAPALYTQPHDLTVDFDGNAIFRVSAKGLEPLDFQWFKDGQPLAGAKSPRLVLTNVTGGDSGVYHALVSNAEGSSTSSAAQLTVIDPILQVQPHSVGINAGNPINLTVRAVGSGLTYQWQKDGVDIPGATSHTLEFPNATQADSAKYQVIITGTYGTLESVVVFVRVNTIVPDLNFRPNWEATTQWFPIQTVVAYNNDLFMGGLFRMLDAPGQRDLVKIKGDGSIDSSFAPVLDGGVINGVVSMSLTPERQLLVGGNFMKVNGISQPYLARLNLYGSLDEGFRPEIDGINNGAFTQVSSIEVLPDGRILIGGGFASVNGQARLGLALLLSNGNLDESFDPDSANAPGITWGSIVQSSGKIIAYGWDFRRFLADGTVDLDFTEAITANGYQLLPLSNGQMLVNAQQGFAPSFLTLIDVDGNPDPNLKIPTFMSAEAEPSEV